MVEHCRHGPPLQRLKTWTAMHHQTRTLATGDCGGNIDAWDAVVRDGFHK
jgi:hypothetical protein